MKKLVPFYQSVWLERLGPVAFGAIALATIFHFRTEIAAEFKSEDWKNTDLYSAIFGWASIQTGFVFGVYGFVASKTDGFIKQVSQDKSFHRFVSYIKWATVAGFILTFFSLPMIVISPNLIDADTNSFRITALWFAFFVWTFCAFLRVAFIFGTIVAVPERAQSIPG